MKADTTLLEAERELLNLMIESKFSAKDILEQSKRVDLLVLEIVKQELNIKKGVSGN